MSGRPPTSRLSVRARLAVALAAFGAGAVAVIVALDLLRIAVA